MLTDRDYELLSAFLDNALLSTERAEVESRLQAEAELRDELEALRTTVSLLNNLSVRKSPRNFTLDTRFARRSTGRWMMLPTSAAFSAFSAIAAVLLIAVSSILLTRNSTSQALPSLVGGQAAQEQQSAFSPTEADENSQKLGRAELEATETALSGTALGDDNLNELLVTTNPPQPSSGDDVTSAVIPPAAEEAAGQAANNEPLSTQAGSQLYAAPSQDNVTSTAAAFSSIAQSSDVPQDGAQPFGLAQEEQPTEAEDAITGAAAGAVAADSANMAAASTPTMTTIPTTMPTPTAAPTSVAIEPTESLSSDRLRDNVTVSDPLPIGLLAIGLALLGIAIATTLARRNR